MSGLAFTILDAVPYFAAVDHVHTAADTLETIADQGDHLRRRLAFAQLCFELVGLDDVELDQLAADVEQFRRLCACLAWRPA